MNTSCGRILSLAAMLVFVAIGVACAVDSSREPLLYSALVVSWANFCLAVLLLLKELPRPPEGESASPDYLIIQARTKAAFVFAIAGTVIAAAAVLAFRL